MKRIYVASPLQTISDRHFNKIVKDILIDLGYEVCLPQEFAVVPELAESLMKEKNIPYNEAHALAQVECWNYDLFYMKAADICFVVVNDRLGHGTCVEAGFMTAIHKEVIGIKPKDFDVGTVMNQIVKWTDYISIIDIQKVIKKAVSG